MYNYYNKNLKKRGDEVMSSVALDSKIEDLYQMVGNTPLLEIKLKYKNESRIIYAKAEHYNLTGSIKDRMALHILKKSYESGILKKVIS